MTHTNTPQETGFTGGNIEIQTGYERQRQQKTPDEQAKDGNSFNYQYNKSAEIFSSGEIPQSGNYSCTNCGTDVTLNGKEKLPPCPRCGNTQFTREM